MNNDRWAKAWWFAHCLSAPSHLPAICAVMLRWGSQAPWPLPSVRFSDGGADRRLGGRRNGELISDLFSSFRTATLRPAGSFGTSALPDMLLSLRGWPPAVGWGGGQPCAPRIRRPLSLLFPQASGWNLLQAANISVTWAFPFYSFRLQTPVWIIPCMKSPLLEIPVLGSIFLTRAYI